MLKSGKLVEICQCGKMRPGGLLLNNKGLPCSWRQMSNNEFGVIIENYLFNEEYYIVLINNQICCVNRCFLKEFNNE